MSRELFLRWAPFVRNLQTARPVEVEMNGTIYFRADHELVGRVIAEKLRRKNDRQGFDDGFRIVAPRHDAMAKSAAV